ncbi:MAG: MerR family transcriptional regulator [Clostridium sp.]|uniref:MerR family transcriptional regulator n=1 Tax=Clostridium sp. TaxID=1506 RepID=UPI002907692C|nr:MerR family transcriptional regulator [Clostridium sp.]MDU5111892.1 MerR family transcriptional regulator [Clostridium sp.]
MSRQRSLEKILESEYVTIGELVRITNSRYGTLKFYTEEGMLNFIQEDEKLTRRFKREEALKRIEEIKELKRRGHRIDEIKDLLKE